MRKTPGPPRKQGLQPLLSLRAVMLLSWLATVNIEHKILVSGLERTQRGSFVLLDLERKSCYNFHLCPVGIAILGLCNKSILMKHIPALLILLSFSVTALPGWSQEPTKKLIRVLIVDDQSPGYYQMPTAIALRNIIRQDPRFEVVLVEDAEILGTDLPFDYDVILLHFKNRRIPKRDAAMKANLEKFVTEGGGLFVFHFSCGAFEDWAGYEQLIGRVWDPKKRAHDPFGQFPVQVIDQTHPITQNLGNFEIIDELYTCLNDSEVPVRILAAAVSKVDGKTYPMAFVLEKGQGRVFHTTLGHNEKSLSSGEFQTIIKQALIWCDQKHNSP